MKVLFLNFLLLFLALFPLGYANEPREIQWDDLIPPGHADSLLKQKKTESIWLNLFNWGDEADTLEEADNSSEIESTPAPVVVALNNQNIKLAGFVVPLDFDFSAETFNDFLLVPYYGACIHVPPPPSNQIVHVSSVKPLKKKWLDNAVWVSGLLETKRVANEYGNAAYSMSDVHLEIIEDSSSQ